MNPEHEMMVITSVQGYCRCGGWGMATSDGLERLRELHAEHVTSPESDATAAVPLDVDFTYPPGQHPGVGPEHVTSCPRRSGANYCWCEPINPPERTVQP